LWKLATGEGRAARSCFEVAISIPAMRLVAYFRPESGAVDGLFESVAGKTQKIIASP